MEIGSHAIFEIDRLANVDDHPFGIAIDITARLGWERGEDALNFF